MIYLVTHGERFGGFDPTHTSVGIEQIKKINLGDVLTSFPLVLLGTGRRHQEVYNLLRDQLKDIPVKPSPFSFF